jgi:hypothetical protein
MSIPFFIPGGISGELLCSYYIANIDVEGALPKQSDPSPCIRQGSVRPIIQKERAT